MKSTDVILTPDGLRLGLGEGHPARVPEPFASLLTEHLAARPNMRTGSSSGSEWLFPGYRAGQHIHPNTLMERLREIGIDLLVLQSRLWGVSAGFVMTVLCTVLVFPSPG